MTLAKFEEQNLKVFQQMRDITEQAKQLKEQEKEIKEHLKQAMEEHDVKKIDNEFVTITYIAESETVKVDWKEVQIEEPDFYKELLEDFTVRTVDEKRFENEEPAEYESLKKDFPKVSKRKAHIRMKVK